MTATGSPGSTGGSARSGSNPDSARNGHADSAGHPWSGRSLPDSGFGDDTGDADPRLLAALSDPEAEVALMGAVAAARLLVPIVAAPTEVDSSGEFVTEKSTDLAMVTLVAPDGTRALPAFSSIGCLVRWDPAARPTPVDAAKAAQAAVAEGCAVMVLDLADSAVVLRPSMVWALATGRAWTPPHLDEHVRQAVSSAAELEADICDVGCEGGSDGALVIRATLRPGLDESSIQALAARIGERIATDGEARARIDAITFRITPAT